MGKQLDAPTVEFSRNNACKSKFTLWVLTFSNLRWTIKYNVLSLFGIGRCRGWKANIPHGNWEGGKCWWQRQLGSPLGVWGPKKIFLKGLYLYKQLDLKMYDKIHGLVWFNDEYLELWVEKRHLHSSLLPNQNTWRFSVVSTHHLFLSRSRNHNFMLCTVYIFKCAIPQ